MAREVHIHIDQKKIEELVEKGIQDILKNVEVLEEPRANLGMATTRELLVELEVRGREGALSPREANLYHTWCRNLSMTTVILLETLPQNILDYKTVDEN